MYAYIYTYICTDVLLYIYKYIFNNKIKKQADKNYKRMFELLTPFSPFHSLYLIYSDKWGVAKKHPESLERNTQH